MSDQISERGQIFIELFGPYEKGILRAMRLSWEQLSKPWSDEQIREGVRRCQNDTARVFAPASWSEFLRYLDAPDKGPITRCYGGGVFDGDWEHASTAGLVAAATATVEYGYDLPDRIKSILRRRGIDPKSLGRQAVAS